MINKIRQLDKIKYPSKTLIICIIRAEQHCNGPTKVGQEDQTTKNKKTPYETIQIYSNICILLYMLHGFKSFY